MLGSPRAACAGQHFTCTAAVVFCSYLTCDILAQVLADTVAAVSEVQICKDDQTAGQHDYALMPADSQLAPVICCQTLPVYEIIALWALLNAHAGQLQQIDIHAVALFFFAQLYSRQAQRPDAMDVWPSQASQDEKAFNSQLMPAHQQAQTLPHQPHHSPLQNGALPGQQEPVSPARSNSSRSSTGSQSSPGDSTSCTPN